MVILGIVAGVSGTGKELKDGGAALLVDGKLVCAIAEERLARVKRAGGWLRSARYCLDAAGMSADDVQVVAHSTCCDSIHDVAGDVRQMAATFPRARIVRAPHHLSHALYAFHGSPFERALVVVDDAGGNIDAPVDGGWWSAAREQVSYFEVDDQACRRLDRDFDEPYAAGFGEVFRAVTYYLGWSGARHANKTMALSAYGDAQALGLAPFFSLPSGAGGILTAVVNDPTAPVDMIARAFGGSVGRLVPPRLPGEPHGEPHKHLAALLQSSYEDSVAARLRELSRRWGLREVCLGGGVAYNCQANAHIAAQPGIDGVYVPPAPGDTGQSIGNALWAHRRLARTPIDRASIADPYTGRQYDPSAGMDLALPADLEAQRLRAPSQRAVGRLVADGLIVGHVHGRSEIGARALGHRSIFADPRRPYMADRLNVRKGREGMMPFGGTILTSEMARLFSGVPCTPYMQFVLDANPEAERCLPAIVHRDRSSRLQSVDRSTCSPWMRAMLIEFRALTGVGAVLNTSLNGPGEPIVETPDEAVRLLGAGVVDCLVVGDTLIAPRAAGIAVD
ncbi:MAG TPA: carbamoyltransferase C-terminal domain-containing protein [Candidatus Dormibacteraeota bacterium]|nr:carbamoyltransferase C-terminal domain-containing protein [Candidatus Dormibacteraeota bacterium]